MTDAAIIKRPLVSPEMMDVYVERDVARQERNQRLLEIRRLMVHHDALALDYYLEERAQYRELVRRCAHRGVPEPRKPTYYNPGKAEAETVEREAPRPSKQPGRVRRYFEGNLVVY